MFDTMDEMTGNTATRTLKTSVTCEGLGLHTGRPVTLTMMPAPVGTGILFRRRDLLNSSGVEGQASDVERITVAATPMAVSATTLGTVVSNRHGVSVATIEHIMSAFAGCGVDHAIVELDGPEIPIMDGSAAPFVEMIDNVGLRELPSPRTMYRLTRPIRVEKGDSFILAVPLAENDGLEGAELDVTVEYADAAIGRQRMVISGEAGDYRQAVAGARTFCYLSDVEAMRAQGLALGGSFDNAIVVSDGEVLNEDGLRFDTEFVRHKALDLIGDLFLLGAPLAALIVAYKPGHELNTHFARTVLEEGAVVREPLTAAAPGRNRARA